MQPDDTQRISEEFPNAQTEAGMLFLVKATENLGVRRDLSRYVFQVLHTFSFQPRYLPSAYGPTFSPNT